MAVTVVVALLLMLTLALLVTLFVTEKADMISFFCVMEQHAPSVTQWPFPVMTNKFQQTDQSRLQF